MMAWRYAYLTGGFRRNYWLPNLIAGMRVAGLMLPLAVVLAFVSGARPEMGIFTAVAAGIVASTVGGSQVQISGPSGVLFVVLSGIGVRHGFAGMQLATLMAGIAMLFLAGLHCERAIRCMPAPVLAGFTMGTGFVFSTSMWRDLMGVVATAKPIETHVDSPFLDKWRELFEPQSIPIALSILTLVILISMPRIPRLRFLPAPLTAVAVVTIVQSAFRFKGVATFGNVLQGISVDSSFLRLSEVTMGEILDLLGPAVSIAVLSTVESLTSVAAIDERFDIDGDANQELIGQGTANIFASLFGGFASSGNYVCSAANVRYGGTSPLSGIVCTCALLPFMLLASPFLKHIPLCSLSVVLVVFGYQRIAQANFVQFFRIANRGDRITFLITLITAIFVDFLLSLVVGLIVATMQMMSGLALTVASRRQNEIELEPELATCGFAHLPDGVVVITIDGPFFFGDAKAFEDALAGVYGGAKYVIVRLRHVLFLGFVGKQVIEQVLPKMRRRGIEILFVEANAGVKRAIRTADWRQTIGASNDHNDLAGALRYCAHSEAMM